MRYRAITMGVVKEKGKETSKPLQSFSDSMEVVITWAHEISEQHKIDVKIFQTYERVLTIVKKPYEKPEEPEKPVGCTCGERIYCTIHPRKGYQKGRKT